MCKLRISSVLLHCCWTCHTSHNLIRRHWNCTATCLVSLVHYWCHPVAGWWRHRVQQCHHYACSDLPNGERFQETCREFLRDNPPLTIFIFISILRQFSPIFSLFLITSPTLQDSHNVAVEAKARIAKLGARAGRFTKLAKLLRRREKWVWDSQSYDSHEWDVRLKGWMSLRHTCLSRDGN